jgi:hypothetical protein
MKIRKLFTIVEETHGEMGRAINPPTRKAAAIAVLKNPFAGQYVEDLSPLMDLGEELGGLLGNQAREALGLTPEQAESYGKACIVGMKGELEHAGAILHPKLGAPFRQALGRGLALIPSVKKRGHAEIGRASCRERVS